MISTIPAIFIFVWVAVSCPFQELFLFPDSRVVLGIDIIMFYQTTDPLVSDTDAELPIEPR